MKISKSLLVSNINAYSEEAASAKALFHKDGKSFLRQLAKLLQLPTGYRIKSNLAGVAGSGEVILHASNLYIALSEFSAGGPQLMYRSCEGLSDFRGGQNHFVHLSELANHPSSVECFIQACRKLAA